MGKVLYSIPLSTLLRTVALWCSRYSSRIKQVIVGRSLTVLTICSRSLFLSFRFKVEQWLILAILVFVLVILFARVRRVISRPLCHDTLSCYCGTIVYGYIGLSCPCFPPFSRTFGSGYTCQTLSPSGSGQSIAWRRYILPG